MSKLTQPAAKINIHSRDLRHAAESLTARAVHIASRLSRDPVLRRAAMKEARRCERIANRIGAILGGLG